jgi:hypothetical protein
MDWTVLVLHAYWDSLIHERDVLLARGAEHPTDDDATSYTTSYGLFIAAALAQLFGHPVWRKMTLSGDGGGVFDLDGSDRAVTLDATRVTATGASRSQGRRRARRSLTGGHRPLGFAK